MAAKLAEEAARKAAEAEAGMFFNFCKISILQNFVIKPRSAAAAEALAEQNAREEAERRKQEGLLLTHTLKISLSFFKNLLTRELSHKLRTLCEKSYGIATIIHTTAGNFR